MSKGRVTGKEEDAQEAKSHFRQVLHLLLRIVISPLPTSKGEQSAEDSFAVEVKLLLE